MSRMLPVKIIPPSPSASTTLSPPRAFLPTETKPSLHLHGLVVGVESFGEGLQCLPGAPRDASRLYLELSHRERYPGSVIQPLLNPTRGEFAAALQELCQQTQENSSGSILLYLSTHGIYQKGVYHLCFKDSRWTESGYEQTVSWPELRTWLAPLRERPVVVVLDCCRQLSTRDATLLSQLPDNREDIVLKGEQWAVFTGASFGEKAWELNDANSGPEGLFTRSLLSSLSGFQGEAVTLRRWYEACRTHLRQQVKESKLSVTQEPRMYVGHLGVSSTQLLPSGTTETSEEKPGFGLKRSLFWLGAVLLFVVGLSGWGFLLPPKKVLCERQLQQQWSHLKAEHKKGQSVRLSSFSDSTASQTPFCTTRALRYFSRQAGRCSSKARLKWLRQRLQRERWLSPEEKRWCQRLLRESTKGAGL